MSDPAWQPIDVNTTFKGYWSDDEREEGVAPWETFSIVLHGHEAGDFAMDVDAITALRASGYELAIRPTPPQEKE